jgi:hypothetical protein
MFSSTASGARSWLIQAARARATGANVHKVNNLCQSYVCARLAGDGGDVEADVQADQLEQCLHAFLKTGDFHTASMAEN